MSVVRIGRLRPPRRKHRGRARQPGVLPAGGAPVDAPPPSGTTGASARREWPTLAVVALTAFVVTVEDTAIAVALPTLARELDLGLSALEWVVNAYTVAIAVLLLTGGRLADVIGRRRVMIIGIVAFTGASLLAGLARSGSLLIAARAAQGAGAALIIPATLAIVITVFPGRRRGMALGVYAGAAAAALAVGPLVGALIISGLGWSWIFLLNVPLGLLGLLAATTLALPEAPPARAERDLDLPGLAVAGVGLLALVFALTEGGRYGWGSPRLLGLLAGSALALLLFVHIERRRAAPLVEPGTFRSRRTAGANAAMLLSTAVMCSVFFFVSLYLQSVSGYSSLSAGAAFLPMTVLIVAVAPLAGRLSDRVGPRLPATAGLALLAAGLALLTRLDVDADLRRLLVALAVVGVGVGLTTTPVTAAALPSSPGGEAGVAAGILNTSRMIGLSLGIAVMGAIVSASWPGGLADGDIPPQAFVDGLSTGFAVNAAIAALTALLAAWALPARSAGDSGAGTAIDGR